MLHIGGVEWQSFNDILQKKVLPEDVKKYKKKMLD